jgi:hypothetical protein
MGGFGGQGTGPDGILGRGGFLPNYHGTITPYGQGGTSGTSSNTTFRAGTSGCVIIIS